MDWPPAASTTYVDGNVCANVARAALSRARVPNNKT